MAFCDLRPVCATDEDSGRTYIIGSVFAVYGIIGSEPPTVYSWDMVRTVTVTRKGITVETANKKFSITNKMFSETEEILSASALIECRQ